MPSDAATSESASLREASTSHSPSAPRLSPIIIDDDDTPPAADPAPSASAVLAKPSSRRANGVVKIEEDVAVKEKRVRLSSSVTGAGKPASAAVGAKPKSTKSAAPRSPSPSPPPPAPPLETIRLDIPLGGPDDYEVDISVLSKATGQRPPTPPPPTKRDTSDDSHSEGDDEGDGKKDKRKRRKRKNAASEYYDTNDPFIDDSELAQDQRTHFAQTKQKGFYVSSGQVALLNKLVTPKKPKSKKVNILAPAASVTAALSAAPLASSLSLPVLSTQDGVSKKRRKTVEIVGHPRHSCDLASDHPAKQPFPPELEQAFDQLRAAIAKENWEVKGKFPQSLKPMLASIALKAILLGQYNDNFFNVMPQLFPYNKFTMSKLIKRTVWQEHTKLLLERQTALLDELKVLAEEGFPKAQEEWERSVVAWEKRQERAKMEAEGGSVAHSAEGTPAASDSQPTPKLETPALAARPSVDDGGNDTGLEHEDGAGAPNARGARDTHAPQKRYRLTDAMKFIIWQLVCLSNECCRIENEKNALEGSNQVVSDQGVRKSLYQKIVSAFPEGWLSSGQISREVSVMKKKYEKEVMENDT
ncbi:hypothetical protein POSPLADRAFT_1184898 [Postia placenta MAD-698-R-SB12]|uniref:Ubinuclein middle domain-containing protein n=1 Tax=Postia placenta MAD-698-R-SB12 TaxID=670580 RepID=A0A1X6MQP9_9APHY|nr:hypothetical protein POSPLADRAFT_1184898 [Postia placenta MAD-698-R-SB12]OSX58483.1 hypothetical protein POSPLADRAFT_1184898 [Postia placenta MAD-698-R-SB12]